MNARFADMLKKLRAEGVREQLERLRYTFSTGGVRG